ncbi:hypothetical protein CHARACLAT_032245 [Characodon lateralis]|uniref:Uncharacterized protein n=1 Tax=Characodon lateralis TaxID=208331 RepID=A0ABU7CT34_9TELE|nr:hypothetical protein [Characodon lateralis]
MSIGFRTMAEESGWNDPAQNGAFRNSLNKNIQDELASREEPETLENLINLSRQTDRQTDQHIVPTIVVLTCFLALHYYQGDSTIYLELNRKPWRITLMTP